MNMIEDMEKQRCQPWRLMSTSTTKVWSGPRLWKANDLYNEGEGTIEGMIWIIHFLIYLDLDLS